MTAAATRTSALDRQVLARVRTTPLLPRWVFSLKGWNWYVREKVERPELAEADPIGALLPDDPRLIYHSHLRLVPHPVFDEVLLRVFHALKADRHKAEGFQDQVIDGPPGTGKSYLLRSIGRAYQVWLEGEDLSRADAEVIPVIHITTPHGADGSISWVWEIAHFLGLTPAPKEDLRTEQRRLPDLTITVNHVLEAAQTRLLLIDDVQRATSDQLALALHYFDYLRVKLGISVVFCGTGAAAVVAAARAKADKLSDAQNAQRTRAKAKQALGQNPAAVSGQKSGGSLPVFWLDPLGCSTAAEQEVWLKVLAAFQADLCLHHLSENALMELWKELHQRTGGHFKHLAQLICLAAVDAMEQGDEDITLERLQRIRIGYNDPA